RGARTHAFLRSRGARGGSRRTPEARLRGRGVRRPPRRRGRDPRARGPHRPRVARRRDAALGRGPRGPPPRGRLRGHDEAERGRAVDGDPRGASRVRVLSVLTYYAPHWTGLTAHAVRLAEGLAARGHEVTVLTTRHAPELAPREVVHGVDVVRLPTIGRFSR